MAAKYSLKPLTDNSWLLLADGDRLGLVTEIDHKLVVMGKLDPKEYDDIHALSRRLGSIVTVEESTVTIKEPVIGDINGFPIKHATHANVNMDPVPNYTRSAKTKERYAAGYFALKFPQGWTQSYCPRLSTLAEYEYVGPFTTRLEMRHQLSTQNKEIRV